LFTKDKETREDGKNSFEALESSPSDGRKTRIRKRRCFILLSSPNTIRMRKERKMRRAWR
jgi:hypothetical protein